MRQFGPIIARRQLSYRGRRSPLTIEIGKPRRRRTGEWECPYRIRGLKTRRARRVLGEDAVQALELVLQVIRLELEPYVSDLSWTGEAGEIGFSRFFPDVYGLRVRQRIERLIDRELAKEGKRLKQRAERAAT